MENEGPEVVKFAWLAGSGGATPRKLVVFIPSLGVIAAIPEDNGVYRYLNELELSHAEASVFVQESGEMPHVMVPGHEAGYTKEVPPPGPTSAKPTEAVAEFDPRVETTGDDIADDEAHDEPSSESDDEVP